MPIMNLDSLAFIIARPCSATEITIEPPGSALAVNAAIVEAHFGPNLLQAETVERESGKME
jgi:hypothetical protein